MLLTPAVSAQARAAVPSGAAATPTRVLAGPPTWPAHPQPIGRPRRLRGDDPVAARPDVARAPQPIKAVPAA